MLENPMDILKQFPVRKSKRQKQAFRDAVQSYMTGLGYECNLEKGGFGCSNLVIGNPETAKYVVTAHYDTPAGMLLPNLITPCNLLLYLLYQFAVIGLFVLVSITAGVVIGLLAQSPELASLIGVTVYWILLIVMMVGPANKNNVNDNTSGVITVLEIARTLPQLHRENVCFVLFDLEEAGLIGSAAYRKAHKAATENQIIFNLDCVGDGDEIVFFPSKKLKKDESRLCWLKRCGGYFGQKKITILDRGFAMYPSDHKQFPLGIGIGAFHRKKGVGLYLSRIHTSRDTILEETNVNILRACISTLISCDAVG